MKERSENKERGLGGKRQLMIKREGEEGKIRKPSGWKNNKKNNRKERRRNEREAKRKRRE